MISLSHVSFEKDGQTLLEDVDFELEPGECVCILGAEGSGKTALLRMLMGLEKPSKGKVTVDGFSLASLPEAHLQLYRRSIGSIEQEDLLIPMLTAALNIAIPLRIHRKSPSEIEKRIAALLLQGNLLPKAGFLPSLLTRSERRMVAFLRAIAAEPKILLIDEPTKEMLPLLKDVKEKGATILLGTTDALFMKELQARTVALQTPSLAAAV